MHGKPMSKAFVKETDSADDEEDLAEPAIPAGTRNYITPAGFERLKGELVRTVSWAASNGDRSENGDYIYGKKRLREIDRRIRFLTKRLDIAEVVDPAAREATDQIYFGATVRYATAGGSENTITIVGIDEVDPMRGQVSWISPIARALLKAREGETVSLRTPSGEEKLEVLEVRYGQPRDR
jgi:transcription elongation factor GreB